MNNSLIDFMNQWEYTTMRPGLERIKYLMELMGNPHKNLEFIHIAGTNGKGSIANFISNILEESGYKTGLFTSPHLDSVNERIKINNQEISLEKMESILKGIVPYLNKMSKMEIGSATYFEILTAIAFKYFFDENCELVVLETGLGGKYDATNIIETSLVSVIAKIGIDHTEILGNDIRDIAYQKAGIIKEKGNVLIYPQNDAVKKVLSTVAKVKYANIYSPIFDDIVNVHHNMDGQNFDYQEYKNIKISLLGRYQINNAVMAMEAIKILREKGIESSEVALRNGILKTKWPGRFEVVKNNPPFIIDGAHNIDGLENLVSSLAALFPHKPITFIFGVLNDKDYKQMINRIISIANKIYTVTPPNNRAVSAAELAQEIKGKFDNVESCNTIQEAILKSESDSDVICAFGSLYLIGEIRKYFCN